jgi:hypothetical protein
LDDVEKKKLNDLQIEWCKQGQRVLILCKRHDIVENVTFNATNELEAYITNQNDFCIVGMFQKNKF